MDHHIRVGGAWKRVAKCHVRVGGAWKEVQNAYVRIGGVWKQYFANVRVILSGSAGSPNVDTDFAIAPADARAGWIFNSTGDCTKYSGSSHSKPEWFGQPGETVHSTPDQTYYIRATTESGDLPDFGTMNTWLALSSGRTWYWEATGTFEVSIGTIKIEIASDSGGTNIVATGYYRGSASTEP